MKFNTEMPLLAAKPKISTKDMKEFKVKMQQDILDCCLDKSLIKKVLYDYLYTRRELYNNICEELRL